MSEGGSGKSSHHLTVTQETDDFGIASPPKSMNYEKGLLENTPTEVSEVMAAPNTTSVHNNKLSPTKMGDVAQKSPRYLASTITDTPPISIKTPTRLTEDMIEESYDTEDELVFLILSKTKIILIWKRRPHLLQTNMVVFWFRNSQTKEKRH